MPTNQQRRDAERRRLRQELEQRRMREAARKRTTLIVSIVGTLVLIAAVVIVIVATTGSDDKKKTNNAGGSDPKASVSASSASSSAAQPPAAPAPTTPCAGPSGGSVTFKGVTVASATDLKKAPKVTSKGTTATALQCQDLVIGKGKAATPTSTVSVQYTGVLYTNGTEFDSSWSKGGKPVEFPLTGVVPGFTQGIGGAGKVAPMHVGGRRIMILPPSLGYGPQANGPIPANSSLVFVVDLVSIGG